MEYALAFAGSPWHASHRIAEGVSKMKKYYAIDLSEDDGPMRAPVYRAEDADAREDELKRALKSAALVISKQLEHIDSFVHIATEALNEADRVLSIAG